MTEPTFETDFDQTPGADKGAGAGAVAGYVSSEPYKMRCPSCRKLYVVSRLSDDDLSRFECVGCQTTFFALRPHGEHVLQTTLLETQFAPIYEQPSSLPTIDGFVEEPKLERSVRSATVPVETNFHREEQRRFATDVGLSENAELVMMWQALVSDYTDEAKHTEFVLRCFRERQLVYAAHKYAQILVAAPQEDIARKMRSRIEGLASYGFDETANGPSFATWQFPLPSFNNLIIFLGAILIVVGFGFPHMRQTAGLGIAMIALAIGLRVFLRRPRA